MSPGLAALDRGLFLTPWFQASSSIPVAHEDMKTLIARSTETPPWKTAKSAAPMARTGSTANFHRPILASAPVLERINITIKHTTEPRCHHLPSLAACTPSAPTLTAPGTSVGACGICGPVATTLPSGSVIGAKSDKLGPIGGYGLALAIAVVIPRTPRIAMAVPVTTRIRIINLLCPWLIRLLLCRL